MPVIDSTIQMWSLAVGMQVVSFVVGVGVGFVVGLKIEDKFDMWRGDNYRRRKGR